VSNSFSLVFLSTVACSVDMRSWSYHESHVVIRRRDWRLRLIRIVHAWFVTAGRLDQIWLLFTMSLLSLRS